MNYLDSKNNNSEEKPKFLLLTSFNSGNEHEYDQLTELMVLIIRSQGLSTLFSAVLNAAKRALEIEKNEVVQEATEEFVLVGSTLNEMYFEKVKGQ